MNVRSYVCMCVCVCVFVCVCVLEGICLGAATFYAAP